MYERKKLVEEIFDHQINSIKYLTDDIIEKLEGTTIFGNYEKNQKPLYFLLMTDIMDNDIKIEIKHFCYPRDSDKLFEEYHLVGKRNNTPVFKRKGE